jgi:RNA polymerase primary sigma factor
VSELTIAGAKLMNRLLRMAVMAGVESAVQIHIERGDDLNARDASGMTPLMLSAARNRQVICKLLLRAGADHNLLDPSGQTALQIAMAAGSEAAAAILDAVNVPVNSFSPSGIARYPDPAPERVFEASTADPVTEESTPVQPEAGTAPIEPENLAALPVQEPCLPLASFVDEMDDGEFDLSGWEAEEEPMQPETDLVILGSASAVQIAITAHVPIDSSTEWDDIDVYLPEVALPLARADDVDGRARLRLLLLRAIREGSVPALDVQAQSTNEDRSANPEAEAYLALVINDLGAEVDERFEYSDASESFEVFVDPEETSDEEEALDEALVAIDRAASPSHEPLRIYQREFQRLRLLTSEEEVQLAKEMEAALEAALDSLATWPDGISRTLAAGADVLAGSRSLSSIWVGGEPDSEPATDENVETDAPAPAEFEESLDENEKLADDQPANIGDATFDNMLRKLAALVDREGGPRASFQETRQALAGLRLDRRFLLELIDAANGLAPCLGFRNAMADFRKARDWMAAANLKLSFFHAKKYLYSGEPLDDLAQEGNIGLLKAVDRYDWRRGFRFSTYATWWIRQQISRYVADKAKTIRVPVHIHEKLQRAERLAQAHEKAIGHKPTLDELAEHMEMPRHKLVTLLHIAPEPSSIDDWTVDDMIAIEDRDTYMSPDPADNVDKIQLNRAISRFISSLSAQNRKEEQVLRMHFGIGGIEALTLDEIGMRFGVTRERIRQIETKALRKLRHPSRSEAFARAVLGLEPERNSLGSSSQRPESDDGSNVVVTAPLPITQNWPTAIQSPRETIQPFSSLQPTALDLLLSQAIEIGALVEDGRETASGRIWVNLTGATDRLQRQFAHKLIEFGFKYWPGEGYRK